MQERLLDFKQRIELGLPVRFQILVVAQQEEAVSFEGLLSQMIQFPPLFSAKRNFDGVIDESRDVVAIGGDGDVRQNLAHGTVGSKHCSRPRPPQNGTIDTSQMMKIKEQNTFLAPNGAHEEPAGLVALHRGFAAAAFGALDQSVRGGNQDS